MAELRIRPEPLRMGESRRGGRRMGIFGGGRGVGKLVVDSGGVLVPSMVGREERKGLVGSGEEGVVEGAILLMLRW